MGTLLPAYHALGRRGIILPTASRLSLSPKSARASDWGGRGLTLAVPLPPPRARTPLLRLYFLQYHLPPGEMHSIMLRLFSLLGDADRHSKLLTRLLALESYMRMREAFLKQAAAAA